MAVFHRRTLEVALVGLVALFDLRSIVRISLVVGLIARAIVPGRQNVGLIMTIVLGHRYWTYPPAQQANQYAHFLKNLALMGGALMLFWSGAGRYSVDARMR